MAEQHLALPHGCGVHVPGLTSGKLATSNFFQGDVKLWGVSFGKISKGYSYFPRPRHVTKSES